MTRPEDHEPKPELNGALDDAALSDAAGGDAPQAQAGAEAAPYEVPGRWDMPASSGGAGWSAPGGEMPGMDFGGFDVQGLLAQAQAMQAQIANAQAELAEKSFTGTAGGGLVTAVVEGNGELQSVAIQPEAVDLADLESLGDLVVAAVRDAQAQMAAVAQATLGAMGGLDF